MCYSAMVEQSHRKLTGRYRCDADLDRYEDVFLRRRNGEKLILPRGMETAFTTNPTGKQERAIAELIREWHAEQVQVRESELLKQTTRLAEAEQKLKKKQTKKALNDRRIASQKIPWLKDKIAWHKSTRAKESDYRIFPQHWLSMVYPNDAGDLVVGPFRYHLRPAWADEKWDYQRDGSYNARRDSLKKAWANQFGSKHGLILVRKFWENVAPKNYNTKPKLTANLREKDNIVIKFEPDDSQYMEVPTIHDMWKRKGEPTLYSTALITDDPLEEIALAGHDRTPVSLTSVAAQQWLSPQSNSKDELFALLDEIKRPLYEHAIAA